MRRLEDIPAKIYQYILQRCEDGVPPTVREICTDLGIRSTSTAHKYLNVLEQDGTIERGKGQNRNIRITDEPVKKVPLVGTVAAGRPILATENIEGYVPYRHRGGGSFFALRVKGDSMIGAGILEGDLLIIRQTQDVREGEIVVALIEDEATVKRFYMREGYFVLRAENKAYEPIVVKELSILGKVVSLIRDYEA